MLKWLEWLEWTRLGLWWRGLQISLKWSRLGRWWSEYKLRHLKLGRVKQRTKDRHDDFEIVGISWNVNWMTHLYLAVIIRDYLRFFIKNTPTFPMRLVEDCEAFERTTGEERSRMGDKYMKRWQDDVNSVADEFDELIKHINCTSDDPKEDYSQKKERELAKKAFSDLAEIYDELWW